MIGARYGKPDDLQRYLEYTGFQNEVGNCALFEAVMAEREDVYNVLLDFESDVINDRMENAATFIAGRID